MKKSKWVAILAVLVTNLVLLPAQAWACACCADDNEYRINLRRASASERELMRNIKFGPSATRSDGVAAAGGDESTYTLTGRLTGNSWNLNLRDGAKSGALTLTLPAKMLSYVVDPHDGQKSEGGGPRLYKEWRFEGRANATGFLRNGGSPTTYFLVFQGRGNRCDNADDFSHWRLELKGARGRYVLTGELAKSSAIRFHDLLDLTT